MKAALTMPKRETRRSKLVAYLEHHPDLLQHGTNLEKDLAVPCACGAGRGRPCKKLPNNIVHISRRLDRLLQGIR